MTIGSSSITITSNVDTGDTIPSNQPFTIAADTGCNTLTYPYFFIRGVSNVIPSGNVSLLGVYPYISSSTWHVGLNLLTIANISPGTDFGGTVFFYTMS
jgi:hypothetical protein